MRRMRTIDEGWLNCESVSEKIIDNGITSFSDKELLKMALSDNSSIFFRFIGKGYSKCI